MTHPKGTDRTQGYGRPFAAVGKLTEDRGGDRFATPLGSSGSGRLRFTNGAHGVVVRGDPSLRGLYSASFAHRMPAVAVCGGAVNIRYPGPSIDERLDGGSSGHDEVALNTSVPWEIEVRGGASRLLADLVDIRLGALAIGGGAGRVEVALPVPVGTVIVVVHGGASNVSIGRPDGVPARLRVEGGATHLRFDDRLIGIAGKDLDLRSRDYDAASCRHDIAVTGGANNVRIDTERGAQRSATTTTTTTR
jgi:hypothetical protein